MANKPLQSIKFPDLPDTYTVPVVDNTLAVSGAAADAKQTGDELAKKVDAVSGKGLSTNDYTDEEKTKLAGVETEATKTIIDNTLTQTGQAADAKAVGDAIANDDKKTLAAFATDTASGSIASFPDGADNIPMKDVLVHIEPVQAGSGDPSPDNVRPITGWTGAKVRRCGKNLLPYPYLDTTKEVNGITFTDNGDGTITANGTATASAQFVLTGGVPNKDYIGCILNGRQGTVANGSRICAQVYKEPWTMFANDYGSGVTITDSGYERIRFIIQIDAGKTFDNLVFRPMLRAPSDTDGTYTPFVKQDVYNITFPSEAGTVYGGTLDVTKGELVVDRAMLYAKDINFTETPIALNDGTGYYIYGGLVFPIASKNKISNIYKSSIIANAWKDRTFGEFQTDTKALVITLPPEADTLAKAKQWIIDNDPYFVYELATPITYTLTTQEITSLLGENNLWADTGDSEVEYRADTKLYITKKITEAVSALS